MGRCAAARPGSACRRSLPEWRPDRDPGQAAARLRDALPGSRTAQGTSCTVSVLRSRDRVGSRRPPGSRNPTATMIVVGDSGPLHYLILIDLIDLLPRLYGTVLIPPAVFSELTATSTPRKVASWVSHPPEWLQVRPVSRDAIRGITEDLDDGEREATLAEAVRADLVLMDDLAGRAEARRRKLRVTRTLGI